MAAPKATVWTREPHTEGKHLVFEHYLNLRSDATIYYAGQVRSGALKPMEREGRIQVNQESRRNRFTYPQGCRINFRPQELRLW